jgi:hypothetical protein
MTKPALKPENVAGLIFFIRGEKVMLDADLAMLYGVTTSVLNQAVKRNRARFPGDFMFQLTAAEWQAMRSQIVIASPEAKTAGASGGPVKRRNIGARPYAFTEQGVAMLSSVLRSPRAVEVNIAIMRTFVQLRRLMDSNQELAKKIGQLEKKYDEQFSAVFNAIKQLIADDTARPKRKIGFRS